ncbi:GLPGLI family protein [Myroides injenensis]|uniref:GLPGLI family protein n=1 Tax=Myroides injenensis TaxID=1183151 RepID=UPI000289D7FF|nr:GLPGLI family protein [Myroides injenensis]
MNKCFVLFLILCFICNNKINAQVKEEVMRYEYQLTFIPYKINEVDESIIKEELLYLDLYGSSSRFISSITLQGIESEYDGVGDGEELTSDIDWVIFKKSDEIKTIERFNFFQLYDIVEPINLVNWTILDERDVYNDLGIQKAIGSWKGRNWIVWFTQDIPLIEGPYKFKNLPGFVVKAEDEFGDYSFELIKGYKIMTYWKEIEQSFVSTTITSKQLKKIKNQSENKSVLQILSENTNIKISQELEDSQILNDKIGVLSNPIELE